MEIYQIVLMAIGAITLVWLLYKTAKGFLLLLEAGMQSCFREKYPYDYQMNLGWVTEKLKSRGYKQTTTIDAGSDYPGVIMRHSETGTEMEVRIHAPLLTNKGYSIIVANHDNNTAIVMQESASDDNKRLLEKYME